jgi:hypothetical protein
VHTCVQTDYYVTEKSTQVFLLEGEKWHTQRRKQVKGGSKIYMYLYHHLSLSHLSIYLSICLLFNLISSLRWNLFQKSDILILQGIIGLLICNLPNAHSYLLNRTLTVVVVGDSRDRQCIFSFISLIAKVTMWQSSGQWNASESYQGLGENPVNAGLLLCSQPYLFFLPKKLSVTLLEVHPIETTGNQLGKVERPGRHRSHGNHLDS